MWQARRGRWAKVLLVAVTLFGATAAVAYATGLVGSVSTISACVNNNGGAVRIVNGTRECKRGERALSWQRGSATARAKKPETAFAHFTNGLLDQSRSSGVLSATRFFGSNTATYCVQLGFVPKNVTTAQGLSVTVFESGLSLRETAPMALAVALSGEQAMGLMPCPNASAAIRVVEGQNSNFADFF